MQFKSVRARILGIILPVLIITLAAILCFSYFYGRSTVSHEIEQKMNNQLHSASHQINTTLASHGKLVEGLARTIEPFKASMTPAEIQAVLKNGLAANADTFGLGISFEPFKYQKDVKYFSTYAYRDKGNITVTQEYSDPSYDYPNQSWFKIAVNTKKAAVFSDPYFDPVVQTSMVTTSAPVYDSEKKLLAVVTGDIDLASIQKQVSNIKVGTTGWAFLIDGQGNYLSYPQSEKVMKVKITDEQDSSLASLGNELLLNAAGKGQFVDQNGTNQVYYQRIAETNWVVAVVMPEKELFAPLQALLAKLSVISLVAVFAVALVIILFSRYLTGQFSKANELAHALAEGDFTKKIDIQSQDEFGRLADSLNKMSENLKHMIEKVAWNAQVVASTSEELTASAEETGKATEQITLSIAEIAAGSDLQVKRTVESSATVSEICTGMVHISESVQSVANSSQEASDKAIAGNEVVSKAMGQMNLIHQRISVTGNIVNSLGEKSKEIENIITLITSISNQTNLLALNAAIEAARAGEQGRGFAVVADEVRKLAEQSSQAAGQVRSIISEIQTETSRAIDAMQDGTVALNDGLTMVNQTGTAFDDIQRATQELSILTKEVSEQIKAVNEGMEKMVFAIGEVTNICEQSSSQTQMVAAAAEQQNASMQEVSSASAMLAKMAEELQQSVSLFKLSS